MCHVEALYALGAIKAAGDDCAKGVNPTTQRTAKITRARPQVQIILSALTKVAHSIAADQFPPRVAIFYFTTLGWPATNNLVFFF